MKPMFTSWSPSRLADYEACPLAAKHKHLLKTCPLCHEGKVMGGFDSPAICDTCGEEIKKGDALVRGDAIGNALDTYLTGKLLKDSDGEERVEFKPYLKKLHPEIRHPKVKEIIKTTKEEIKKGLGAIQVNLSLTRKWEVWTGKPWSPEVWLRARLDYRAIHGNVAKVIDWKTGGIDKRTGEVRASEKYDDQLSLYNLVTLVSQPKVEESQSALVFLDCGPRFDPKVERGSLKRAELEKEKKRWEKKVLALFRDDTFAPRPNGTCRFCDFAKGKGGPCPY